MRNAVRAALCGVALGSLAAAAVHAQDATIEVSNAQFQGNTVLIPSATVTAPAFVVVHADDADQTVLGHAALNPGVNQNVAVTLDRQPEPGEEFIVMLHEDVGTAGAFEMEADPPLMVTGVPVTARVSFAEVAEPEAAVAIAEPEAAVVGAAAAGIDVSNATHTGNVLSFSSVTMPTAGFLVIHAEGPDEPILGQTPLQPGINQNVSVTLERDPAVGETLTAMLHVDEGAAGQFEPELDGALAAEGAVLIGPGGEELTAAAGDPVAVRFRVASRGEAAVTASGEAPAERSAAEIPEAEATVPAPDGAASAPSGGSAGGSSGGY